MRARKAQWTDGWPIRQSKKEVTAGAFLLGVALLFQIGTRPATAATTYSVLASFQGNSYSGLIADSAGNLYGATYDGGIFGYGSIFELPVTGGLSLLYSFTGDADGANPYGGSLLRDSAGNLYGTATHGGSLTPSCFSSGCGVIFRLNPTTGKEKVLYAFTGGSDGAYPFANLITDGKGALYGTADAGGSGYGVVFKLSLQGSETVLYTFSGGNDGAFPSAGLVRDSAGNLYGTTTQGGGYSCGSDTCGVVFKVDPLGNETVLHAFTGGADGGFPIAGLVLDAAGDVYGTTANGGDTTCFGGASPGCGVVFEIDPAGNETVLYSFAGAADGAFPNGSLVRDATGNLYGTSLERGDILTCGGLGCGTIFRVSGAGQETTLYDFVGGFEGSFSYVGLLPYRGGYLYGTTSEGGSLGGGLVFKLKLP